MISNQSAGQRSSYDPAFYPAHFHRDEGHFWFRARNQILACLVKQIALNWPSGYRVLEIGCGIGTVLRMLEKVCDRGRVFGMDLLPEGLKFARRQTSSPLVQGDTSLPPFKERFELICLFDVLEHLEGDLQSLRNLKSLLEEKGVLLLTVPAHQSLWSYADEVSCHFRRYAPAGLEKTIAEAGYRVFYCSEFMMGLYPLLWLGRWFSGLGLKLRGGGEKSKKDLARAELRPIPVVNELLTCFLAQEARLIARRIRLPLGTSILAVACKEAE
jgi:SAM-dependent methyltransferase